MKFAWLATLALAFAITAPASAAPSNDLFSAAIVIPITLETVAGQNFGADAPEQGEPKFPGRDVVHGSVWYKFETGSKAGRTLITTWGTKGGVAQYINAVFDVFTGKKLKKLNRVATAERRWNTYSDVTSAVFDTDPDTTYYVRVASELADTGWFRLTLNHFGASGGTAALPHRYRTYGPGPDAYVPIVGVASPSGQLLPDPGIFLIVNASKKALTFEVSTNAIGAQINGESSGTLAKPVKQAPAVAQIAFDFSEVDRNRGASYSRKKLKFAFPNASKFNIVLTADVYRQVDDPGVELKLDLVQDGAYETALGEPVFVQVNVRNVGNDIARNCSLYVELGLPVPLFAVVKTGVLSPLAFRTEPVDIAPGQTKQMTYSIRPAIIGKIGKQVAAARCLNVARAFSRSSFTLKSTR